jgi:hypothetical protein
MKRIFLIFPVILVLCFTVKSQVNKAETSSEDLEKELRATVERLVKAGRERDLDTKFEIQGDAIGYGYRSKAPRRPNEKLLRIGSKMFWNSMETFEAIPNEESVVYHIVGNVGVVLGTFTEKFKPKGGELQTIEVRFSMTFAKIDGKWKQVQYHRDTQFAK